jgi:hypothetical protein
MNALPFILIVGASLAATLGYRRVAVWIWVAAFAALAFVARYHAVGAASLPL